MKPPKPGIYSGVPFSEYEQWEAVNNSTLWTLKTQSPLHAKTFMENPPEPTEAFIIGQAFHTLVLEPRKFNKFYLITPVCDRRTKEGKAIYEAFQDNLDGQEILTKEQFDMIDVMADSIKKQIIHRLIEQGEAEVCIVWIDKKTGLVCKARIDYVHREMDAEYNSVLIDLKSTRDASPNDFSKAIYNYGYYQQCAFYSDGWNVLTGDPTAFVFLPVEKKEPFAVAAYEMHEQVIFAGRQSYRQALDTFAECKKKDEWPGYAKEVVMLSLPQWALRKEGIGNYQIFE